MLSESNYRNSLTVGIDIGKNSSTWLPPISAARLVLDRSGRVARWTHDLPTCRVLVGMEACVGAQHLSRKLKRLVMMPADAAKYVRPYSKETERLPRRGGDCRSGAAPDHEVRGDEDRR